jgi:hypothetical protein
MKRGKFLGAMLGIAGVGMLALGIGSTPASAQAYAAPVCAAGYYYANGYCYPYQAPPVVYAPPTYYAPPPVVVGPSFGIGFGFGGGFHDRDDFRGGDHDFHGGGHRR